MATRKSFFVCGRFPDAARACARYRPVGAKKKGGRPRGREIPDTRGQPPRRPKAYNSFDRVYRPAALAQESRKATDRLKTGFCGVPSLSAQK